MSKITTKLTLKKGKEILLHYGMGASSNAILNRHLGNKSECPSFPYDSSDFMRCLGLVRVFNIDIDIMKGYYIWNRIIRQWDELVNLCLEDKLYEASYLLQEIYSKPKSSFEIVNDCDMIISITESPSCETSIKLLKNSIDNSVFNKWSELFDNMTKEHAIECEKLAISELNGINIGELEKYMKNNNLISKK